ncbi:MAG: division/cell wall cluster transcriptional repressor MraZ [Melioribacteraceae bacterium]|nr:division/cell wall cluster transcriptional repressor MraZ [Melioribacteraceae bacterium]
MFVGSYKYSVDAKGRVSIPAKLRKNVNPEANDNFMMTRAMDQCIVVYPMDLWKDTIETKINQLDEFDETGNRFLRIYLQNAFDDTIDSQARISLPQHLRNFAGIEKDALIIGAGKKIEIWNPTIYDEYLNADSRTYTEIAKEVMNKR